MSDSLNLSVSEVDQLLSPQQIRHQAGRIFDRTVSGEGVFRYHPDRLIPTVDFVLQIIRKNYPDLQIPFHSRWGHFNAGGIHRKKHLLDKIRSFDALEQGRIQLDLVITSVLLDAGAGSAWKFQEPGTGVTIGRSEGLGLASFYLFLSGSMSSDGRSLRADHEGLKHLSLKDLLRGFQVTEKNPLIGAEGRLTLLNNLSKAVSDPRRFRDGRPGNILDFLMEKHGRKIPATAILKAVLEGFGSIWPGRLKAQGRDLGDVWIHRGLGAPGSFQSLVPFHKLSQWMTYSLLEPMMEAGIEITGVEDLTGLAEYRNGGLLIDSGLVSSVQEADLQKTWTPDSEFIIEWRGLTVHLLDVIGEEVRRKLGKSSAEFPLAKVLEGGTWWAGRALASEKRAGGEPPVKIQSDGTVF